MRGWGVERLGAISACCMLFYAFCMFVRWHALVIQDQRAEGGRGDKGDQKKANEDMRTKALDHEMSRTRMLHAAMEHKAILQWTNN